MNTADKAENAAQRMSDAMKNINWEQRSYANKSYTYEDGAPTSAQYQYAYDDSKSTVVVTKKAKGGTTTNGLTITGDGTGTYAGQEAYIGQDGRLHLFNNEAQLSELPPNTRIVNAKDLQNIIKYTGMKYFYQPIENIQSATLISLHKAIQMFHSPLFHIMRYQLKHCIQMLTYKQWLKKLLRKSTMSLML